MFPIVVASCLRGLGPLTKDGAVLLTAAISGGAIFPVIANAVRMHHSTQYAFCVVLAGATATAAYPIYLTVLPYARQLVDPTTKSDRAVLPTTRDGIERDKGDAGVLGNGEKN